MQHSSLVTHYGKSNDQSQLRLLLTAFALLSGGSLLFAQQIPASNDSAKLSSLAPITITAYPAAIQQFTSTAAVAQVSNAFKTQRFQPGLLSVINTVPGVRMEERSPGSYRLSIRGSLLRSPFGVRNVKVYYGDFPLTDAGGNTYLNSLAFSDHSKVEIIRGPDGSLFGANTGGVVHIIPEGTDQKIPLQASFAGGSFGLLEAQAAKSWQGKKQQITVLQSYQQADGYRQQSAMHRYNGAVNGKVAYHPKAQLQWLVLYSDLHYQTPGGLTLAQATTDPTAARPATATLPGAVQQKAAVDTKLWLGGLSNQFQISQRLKQTTIVSGTWVQFKNPFITNYETRKENTVSLRALIEYSDKSAPGNYFKWKWHTGTELQQTNARINNYNNNRGIPGSLQSNADIRSRQAVLFTSFKATIDTRWIVDAGLSYNQSQQLFKAATPQATNFQPQWMPRLATSYRLLSQLLVRLSVSRGYSPPTTAETRPTTNRFYPNLNPEYGWNYEAGFRIQSGYLQRFTADVALFHFRLQQAIVRNLDAAGNDFYTNTGSTRQTGIESAISYQLLIPRKQGWLRSLLISNSNTWSHFRFKQYQKDGVDYAGNRITGVPAMINVFQVQGVFPAAIQLAAVYNYTGKLPLNDANSAFADAYHLVQIKVSKQWNLRQHSLEISGGIDNLLNQRYSLGNDLNAAGNRYYNPAPTRNILLALRFQY